MPQAHISPVANRLGAVALTLSDGIREATEAATGMAGGLPAALVSLHEWADGRSVDVLAGALRVTHSRAVRVVDQLEAAGLARREPDPSDGRRALVRLQPEGHELAERALAARARLLDHVVAELDPERAGPAARRDPARHHRRHARGGPDLPAVRRARLRSRRRAVPRHARREPMALSATATDAAVLI